MSSRSVRSQDPAQEPLRLETFLPYRLAVLAHRISRAIARRYEAEFDLSIPEWRVMALLAQQPGLSAAEVAARTPMDKVAVSRAVASLAGAGRVSARPDAEDARRQKLALTPRGLAIYRRIVPMARALEARLLDGFTVAERQALLAMIARLDAGADALEAQALQPEP